MVSNRLVRYLCVITMCITAAAIEAKEVTLMHKGLILNATLEFASGKNYTDGIILITHGGLAHRNMEIIVYLQELFKEYGYNTLAINLSLGLDDRHGMYDCRVIHRHHNDDAADEIDAWVKWLKKQGVNHVTLLGHSRGGAQTAHYMLKRDSSLVNAVVLLAPATRENTDAKTYQRRYNKPLAPMLEKAQKLVNKGNGDTVFEHANLMRCHDTPVTADAFISYYGQHPRLDTPTLIPKITKPTLVLVAGNDQVVIGLEKKIAPLVDGKHVQMKVIEAADHLFRDLNSDDAVEEIDAFLDGVN